MLKKLLNKISKSSTNDPLDLPSNILGFKEYLYKLGISNLAISSNIINIHIFSEEKHIILISEEIKDNKIVHGKLLSSTSFKPQLAKSAIEYYNSNKTPLLITCSNNKVYDQIVDKVLPNTLIITPDSIFLGEQPHANILPNTPAIKSTLSDFLEEKNSNIHQCTKTLHTDEPRQKMSWSSILSAVKTSTTYKDAAESSNSRKNLYNILEFESKSLTNILEVLKISLKDISTYQSSNTTVKEIREEFASFIKCLHANNITTPYYKTKISSLMLDSTKQIKYSSIENAIYESIKELKQLDKPYTDKKPSQPNQAYIFNNGHVDSLGNLFDNESSEDILSTLFPDKNTPPNNKSLISGIVQNSSEGLSYVPNPTDYDLEVFKRSTRYISERELYPSLIVKLAQEIQLHYLNGSEIKTKFSNLDLTSTDYFNKILEDTNFSLYFPKLSPKPISYNQPTLEIPKNKLGNSRCASILNILSKADSQEFLNNLINLEDLTDIELDQVQTNIDEVLDLNSKLVDFLKIEWATPTSIGKEYSRIKRMKSQYVPFILTKVIPQTIAKDTVDIPKELHWENQFKLVSNYFYKAKPLFKEVKGVTKTRNDLEINTLFST